MKKFVAGVVVGAMLFAGTSVFADSIKGLIGMKVGATYEVIKNGKKIGDAALIGDKAYVPVRATSDAAGIPLVVKGKTITMGEVEASKDRAYSPEDTATLGQITTLENDIRGYEKDLAYTEESEIKPLQERLTAQQAKPEDTQAYREGIKILQDKIKDRQDYASSLKAKISESKAKIDALKAQLSAK
ncbi:hypothetical protein [Paenibacillus tuaregi]|uniref:hypothetical protein n=1 Tax=Paenibacillus tuaregi TaxID=1816681 RepID=UPI0008384A1B|nr:hypothetical protein [Paenibacillus tuaregi]